MLRYITLSLLTLTAKFMFAAAPIYVPTSGLQAWYSFDGNANNAHSGSFNGTVNGATLTTDRFGNANSAYIFDGVDDFINLGTSILDGAAQTSVSCWVKITRFTTVQNIWQKRRQSNGDGMYIATYNSSLYAGLNREPMVAVGQSYTPFTSFNNSSWVHFVLNNNNGALTLYVNGILFSQITLPTGALVGNQPFYVGRGFDVEPDLSGTRSFQGSIDDVGIWSRVLTAQEIGNIYQRKTTLYSKSSGNLNVLSTWGTNTDGSGTSPLNFDSSNVVYNVVNNTSPSLGGNFKVGGAGSVVVLGDGTNAFNLIIGANDTLSCDSVYIQNNITVTATGTLLTQKLNAHNSSTVQYTRSSTQPVAAGTYGNFIAMSSTKTLIGNTTVKNNLVMVASINCATYNLTLGSSAAAVGTLNRTQGTIIGSFTRWFANATNNAAAGIFPIGGGNNYAPLTIEFTAAPTQGGAVTCQFITGAAGNNGLPQFDFANGAVYIDKPAPEGIWRLSGSGLTGGTFTTTVGVNNFAGVTNYLGLRIIRRNISNPWTLNGTAAVNTGTNTEANIIRTGMTNVYGEYGVGGDQSQNPLPVKLTNFSARLKNNNEVLVEWKTAFEMNADKFIVERSTDMVNWETQGIVKAKGYSASATAYQFTNPVYKLTGTIYYRLAQVDIDGSRTNSSIAQIMLKPTEKVLLHVVPNPSTNYIQVSGFEGNATIYDITGNSVGEVKHNEKFNVTYLPSGVYFVRTATQATKFIKQ